MAGREATAFALIALTALAAAPAAAEKKLPPPPSAKPVIGAPATTAPTPSPATAPARRQIKLSDAGVVIAKKYLSTPDPQIKALFTQRAAIVGQIATLAAATPIDMARVESLMGQSSAIENRIHDRQNALLIAMLRELSEPDRASYLRTATAIPTPPPAPPPPPGARPPVPAPPPPAPRP